MDEKIKKLEQKFLHFQHNLSEESARKRDLDKAMGDTVSADKEQIKIDIFNRCVEIFEQVKNEGSLEDVTNSFMNRLDEERGKLEQLISQAKEQENTQVMIENQIRKSMLKGPIGGIFKFCLKQVQKA